ncbi:hypothetical protein LX36DRAFT_675863 [Colletotrichum falcatum]|nr:hypothetical protein LX36DRAFT_675863 [Colletotrichum falcatum]
MNDSAIICSDMKGSLGRPLRRWGLLPRRNETGMVAERGHQPRRRTGRGGQQAKSHSDPIRHCHFSPGQCRSVAADDGYRAVEAVRPVTSPVMSPGTSHTHTDSGRSGWMGHRRGPAPTAGYGLWIIDLSLMTGRVMVEMAVQVCTEAKHRYLDPSLGVKIVLSYRFMRAYSKGIAIRDNCGVGQ